MSAPTPIPTHVLTTFTPRQSQEDEPAITEAKVGLANTVWQMVGSPNPNSANSIFDTATGIVAAANAGSVHWNFAAPESFSAKFRESMHRTWAKEYLPPQVAQKYKESNEQEERIHRLELEYQQLKLENEANASTGAEQGEEDGKPAATPARKMAPRKMAASSSKKARMKTPNRRATPAAKFSPRKTRSATSKMSNRSQVSSPIRAPRSASRGQVSSSTKPAARATLNSFTSSKVNFLDSPTKPAARDTTNSSTPRKGTNLFPVAANSPDSRDSDEVVNQLLNPRNKQEEEELDRMLTTRSVQFEEKEEASDVVSALGSQGTDVSLRTHAMSQITENTQGLGGVMLDGFVSLRGSNRG